MGDGVEGVSSRGGRGDATCDTRLEAGLGGGAALLVRELGLGSKRLCVNTMCEYDQKRMECGHRFEF